MRHYLLLFPVFLFLITSVSVGQMLEPGQWVNFEKVLGVKNKQRSYDFEVAVVASANNTNVLWPGEQPQYTIQIINKLDSELSVSGKIDIIQIGTKGIMNDVWHPELFKIGDAGNISVTVNIAPKKYINVNLSPRIGSQNGAYALVLDLGKYGRQFITSVVRTFAADTSGRQFPQQSLDDMKPQYLERLGVHAIRLGVEYVPTTFKESVERMQRLDKKLKEYKAKNITVLLMFGEGPMLMPLGKPRPFLDSNGTALKTKADYTWLPSLDDDFKSFVHGLCVNYGWPAGPVTAVSLWNEPWEGISISGWQADMLRYREIYQKMAEAVLDARKKGADVLVGGADSHSNAFDKLFADGKNDFLPVFDFCSIHYEGLEAPGIYPDWINRKNDKGRVKIWDTESWVGNTDDRIGTVIATNYAAGYDRCMGIYAGYLFSNIDLFNNDGPVRKQKVLNENGVTETTLTAAAWPQIAAFGAAQHMIGERKFKEILFKKGLPWIMLFNGIKNDDDGTAVICGDIGEAFGNENVLLRGVRSELEIEQKEKIGQALEKVSDSYTRDSLLKGLKVYHPIKNAFIALKEKPFYKIYDSYGNQLHAANGIIQIPLGSSCYYAKPDGNAGSFLKMKRLIEQGRVTGYEPIEIIAKDLTERVERKPEISLNISNILNRSINGKLAIDVGDLQISYSKTLSFSPFETRMIKVKIIGGKPADNNTYPISVRFDAGIDGLAVHYEDLHVNLVSKLSPVVDGVLDDWPGALPQHVNAGDAINASTTEAAWYPFKNFSNAASGSANGYLAYNDDNFYFASKVADTSFSPGAYRFANRDDDEFFYPDTSFTMDPDQTFIIKERTNAASANNVSALQHPLNSSRLLNYWESGETTNSFAFDIDLSSTRMSKLALYLPNLDVPKAIIEVYNRAGNELLSTHSIDQLWDGAYIIFKAAGNIRVVIRSSGWWYTAKLAGIFIDETSEIAMTVAADYIGEDLDTKGNWKNIYGKSAYYIAGVAYGFTKAIPINFIHKEVKQTLIWPNGVRNFSYRKDPVLPDNSGLGFSFDNVLIAFNVVPVDEDELLPNPPGTMPGFTGYKCTDYEFALNPVAEKYGGGTEVWRLLVPGMNRKHFFPRQPKSIGEGAVTSARLVIRREGNTVISECAIPWDEIPLVKKALDEGKKIKFSFRVNDNGGKSLELAQGRSVSKQNARAFHPDWKVHWANEVEFGFEK